MCDTKRVQNLVCVNSIDEMKSQSFELVLNSVSSDGGQFALLLLEGVRGRPLPDRFQMAFMQSGFVFLVGLSLVLIVKDTSQLPAIQQLLSR